MNRWEVFQWVAGSLRPGEWAERPALPAAAPPWKRIVAASSWHEVTTTLAWRLNGHPQLDADTAAFFSAVLTLNRERNAQLLLGMTKVVGMLNAAGITPLLLKGSGLLATQVYPDAGMRVLGDVDLLVAADELRPAYEALRHGGLLQPSPMAPQDFHQVGMLIDRATGVGVELHRYPASKALETLIDTPAVLQQSSPISFGGVQALRPSIVDHIAVAIAQEQIRDGQHKRGVPQLKRLLDIAVLRKDPQALADWSRLERRFVDAG